MRKKTEWGVEMAKLRQPSEHMVLGKPFAAELQIFFDPAGESATKIASEKRASQIKLENTFKVISDATPRSIGTKLNKAVASILFYTVAECDKKLIAKKPKEFKACEEKLVNATNATSDFFESLKLNSLKKKSGNRKVEMKVLIDRLDKEYFYQYEGSATEPPCYEGFAWNVYSKAMPVREKYIAMLEKLYSKNEDFAFKLRGNNRRVQPINKR